VFAHHDWLQEIQRDNGQALLEYALTVSRVAVVGAGTLVALGGGVDGLISGLSGAL
jgi:Flp pilus assembly pilin Flp